jgi:hypothetical protein
MPDKDIDNNGDWLTWRMWIKESIRQCTENIKDLYDVYHDLERTILENHRTIDLTILKAINDTRKDFRIELEKLEKNYTELREKILTTTVFVSVIGAGTGSILTILARYLIDIVFSD